ncbi:MAG: hypothetical protein E5Y79_13050 [Mesorhizobium sp.]|uniref:hypothetical protein n=1 Tax=Mesorhizobium sp. TaxID=1871066 RepID=UPI0012257D21|nr:hypothetical protein [Mesorhizobium sp.]TIL59662.1 MAG: hypothetical protein E5Y79_13050 [Mesorhizobium sp.]
MNLNKSSNADFYKQSQKESWFFVTDGFFDAFKKYIIQHSADLNPYVTSHMQAIYPQIQEQIGNGAPEDSTIRLYLDPKNSRYIVALSKRSDDFTLAWTVWKSEEALREHEIDGAACLRKLAVLALGDRKDVVLKFSEQEDKAFMWKASSVHPLQVLENAYQRIVHKAKQEPGADPVKAQSKTLARYFIQDEGPPVFFDSRPSAAPEGTQLASVRMNHLIETFYLFRLLVRYQVESAEEINEDLRVDLSGNLTKLLHNGDRAKMGWLSVWLSKKMGELGEKIDSLNTEDERRVLFFLKGGRALNFFLGTPQNGENDWDTQVVIDPSLPAEKWYEYFSRVHDLLLTTLQTFKSEFTPLVEANAALFADYLKSKAGAETGEDEEVDENEASDVNSRGGTHASCKAELIDIGIPRRDSPSALEEWTRLSAPGALKTSADGVVYPHREYYLNEYLMMIRDAFIADVKKAPKRITRFGMILASEAHEGPLADDAKRLTALPKTLAKIEGFEEKPRQELFRIMMSQFVEAYNLLQDRELATLFDEQSLALITTPPSLPAELAAVLDEQQKKLAGDVGVAHALSELMTEHWKSRSEFFTKNLTFFVPFVRGLSQLANPALRQIGAQFAVAGSYAARLHADHLRVPPDGLEPIRRILVKLQCPQGRSEADTLNAVREAFRKAATDTGKLRVGDFTDTKNRSLVLYWHEKVTIGNFTYAPLVMKIRGAAQTGSQLPVLSSIDGIPVLDLRYLVADYRKKTSKIDEQGSRRTLASATAAVSEMLSRFDFDSDDESESE